jgi:hypothetical protein
MNGNGSEEVQAGKVPQGKKIKAVAAIWASPTVFRPHHLG